MFQLYVGDTAPSIPMHFGIDGEPVNLAALVVSFSMTNRDTGELKVVAQPVTLIGGGVGGDAQYDWATDGSDTNVQGVYDAWAIAMQDGDLIQSLELGEVHVDYHGAVTLVQVRELVETGLSDTALQVMLDDAVQTIENRFGTVGPKVLLFNGFGLSTLGLMTPAQAVTQIRERSNDQTDWVVTDPSNYSVENNGRTLRKVYAVDNLGEGWTPWNGNGAWWSRRVEVTYLPKSDIATRRRVTIDLVRLAAQYSGLSTEKIGTYAASPLAYTDERERLLCQIQSNRSGFRFA